MFEHAEIAAGLEPVLRPYREFWASYLNQATETTKKMFESANGGADPRAWQRRWLEVVSQSMDAYLRSPIFLRMMKENMDAAVKTKLRAADFHKEVARNVNVPTASDIRGLFDRLRSVEQSILTRLTDIDERLEAIESAAQGEAPPAGAENSGPGNRTRPKSRKKPRG